MKNAVLLLLVFMTFVPLSARKVINGNPAIIASNVVERMQNDIELTDSQKLHIKKIISRYIVQVNNASDSEIETLSVQKRKAIDSVLTGSQKEKLILKRKARMKIVKSSK